MLLGRRQKSFLGSCSSIMVHIDGRQIPMWPANETLVELPYSGGSISFSGNVQGLNPVMHYCRFLVNGHEIADISLSPAWEFRFPEEAELEDGFHVSLHFRESLLQSHADQITVFSFVPVHQFTAKRAAHMHEKPIVCVGQLEDAGCRILANRERLMALELRTDCGTPFALYRDEAGVYYMPFVGQSDGITVALNHSCRAMAVQFFIETELDRAIVTFPRRVESPIRRMLTKKSPPQLMQMHRFDARDFCDGGDGRMDTITVYMKVETGVNGDGSTIYEHLQTLTIHVISMEAFERMIATNGEEVPPVYA